ADPRALDGNKAQFSKWWVNMRVWVMQNDNALPTLQDKVTAVCTKGPTAGCYVQACFTHCINSGTWPTWNKLKMDIKLYFAPQLEVEWA
ncbi:hypothetical protein EDD16DRAFT_1487073, partial [Pisolithus croceorrhizus]